jgi:hypothetical protein
MVHTAKSNSFSLPCTYDIHAAILRREDLFRAIFAVPVASPGIFSRSPDIFDTRLFHVVLPLQVEGFSAENTKHNFSSQCSVETFKEVKFS